MSYSPRPSAKGKGKDNKLRIALLGDGAVGKSSLTVQFTQKQFFTQYDPTIENAYSKEVVVDGQQVDLEIIDTAGQEEFSVMRGQYIRSGQGFFLVYTVTSQTTLDNLQAIVDEIHHIKGKKKMSCCTFRQQV